MMKEGERRIRRRKRRNEMRRRTKTEEEEKGREKDRELSDASFMKVLKKIWSKNLGINTKAKEIERGIEGQVGSDCDTR